MIGLKALQGIYRYLVPFGGNLTDIYAVTGHEDALFFDTMLILALAFAVYGGPIRQRMALWGLTPALAITLLLTRRRAALVALVVGLGVVPAHAASGPARLAAQAVRAHLPDRPGLCRRVLQQ